MAGPVNVRRIILNQKRAVKCPLLDKFIRASLSRSRGSFLSTEDCFREYETVVARWTDGDSVDGQTAHLMKEKSFHRQFNKAITALGWPEVRKTSESGKRGYVGLTLKRTQRQPGLEFGGTAMRQRVANYARMNPPPPPPIELHAVPSDPRNAGICGFASRDIERGEVVVEYEGELITSQEADEREARYAEAGKPCTLMVIQSAGQELAIDPYRGNSEEAGMTWAACLNHSKRHANLRPYVADKNTPHPRVFMVALHDIPQTVEFLWNYNDPSAEFHDSSQTLP